MENREPFPSQSECALQLQLSSTAATLEMDFMKTFHPSVMTNNFSEIKGEIICTADCSTW